MNTTPPTYIGNIADGTNVHPAHWMDVYVTEPVSPGASDAELLAMIANSTYFNAVMAAASATTHSGPNGTIELRDPIPSSVDYGVAWIIGSQLHFASDIRIDPTNPYTNHS